MRSNAPKKTHLVRARIPDTMKDKLDAIAHRRGEGESVILREAITFYLSAVARKRAPELQRLLWEARDGEDGQT